MNAPLRGCPLCSSEIAEGQLGLRDYRWLEAVLPGRVAPTDLDFMLERHGRFLVLEFKPPKAGIPLGQRITLKSLAALDAFTVWVVWHAQGADTCVAGVMDRYGNVPFSEEMSLAHLRGLVKKWFYADEDS